MGKMRRGSECWKDHSCLFDHYETQPMPNPLAWYFHRWVPHPWMRLMQWYAIDVAEVLVPYLLLSFVISMGPIGALHHRCRESKYAFVRWPAQFPGRLVGSTIITTFVIGMAVGGNYAFLHPLAVVALVASMGTVRGAAVQTLHHPTGGSLDLDFAKVWYRRIAPWIVMAALAFSFIPSLRAYAWLRNEDETVPAALAPLMRTEVAHWAEEMNLGIPYNHHAYFAGAVHQRNEMVLFADLGDGHPVELDVPCKVGRVDRAPCITSPLHRRFAWQWWFLGLGSNPSWMELFLEKLCQHDADAWGSLELSGFHHQLTKVKRVYAHMHSYHFSKRGSAVWWDRKPLMSSWRTYFEQVCD